MSECRHARECIGQKCGLLIWQESVYTQSIRPLLGTEAPIIAPSVLAFQFSLHGVDVLKSWHTFGKDERCIPVQPL